MINLDLMELADLSHPVQIAKKIISQNPGIQAPIPLEDIAHAAGIVEINKEPMDGLEGALIANTEKSEGIILIKEGARPQRQRFTLGHELGHYFIPRHGHQMRCGISDLMMSESKTLSAAQRMELEANQFSAELLMPSHLVKQYAAFRGTPSLSCVIEMAEVLDVSFEAFALRYVALHDDPVAIVFAKDDVVRYSPKSNDFPFWIRPGKGSPIPSGSHSSKAGKGFTEKRSEGYCDADVWIDGSKYFEMPEEIQEELYVMEDGYTATLLYFNEELEEIES